MKQWKKRLIVLLCTILVAPTVLQALPVRPMTQVQAAGNAGMYSCFATECDYKTNSSKVMTVTVEVGEKIELGYFFDYENNKNDNYTCGKLADLKKGVAYSSSKGSVVAVNKKTGLMTPKKVGKATIKVKYAGDTQSIPVKVVKKGGLKLSSYSKYEKVAKDILSINPKKVNASNQYTVLKKVDTYKKLYDEAYIGKDPMNEMGMKTVKSGTYTDANGKEHDNYIATNTILAPSMAKAYVHLRKVCQYFIDNNPVSTNPSKMFKTKSVSVPKANAKTFTITLKKKVTDTQICALKAYDPRANNSKKDGKATFRISIVDVKSNKFMTAYATAKKGSNKITVTLKKNTDPYYSTKTKFTKGKYQIRETWLNKKFTVK